MPPPAELAAITIAITWLAILASSQMNFAYNVDKRDSSACYFRSNGSCEPTSECIILWASWMPRCVSRKPPSGHPMVLPGSNPCPQALEISARNSAKLLTLPLLCVGAALVSLQCRAWLRGRAEKVRNPIESTVPREGDFVCVDGKLVRVPSPPARGSTTCSG